VSDRIEYIAAGLLDAIKGEVSWEPNKLKVFFERHYDTSVGVEEINAAVDILFDCDLAFTEEDPYAGRFMKIYSSRQKAFLDAVDQERDPNFDGYKIDQVKQSAFSTSFASSLLGGDRIRTPNLDRYNQYKILRRYHQFGSDFIKKAISAFPERKEEDELNLYSVPASDRIVSLSDNQTEELESATERLIDALIPENAIDGDAPKRDRFLGQLRAGRELIRSKTLSAYLLYQTLMQMLGQLIEKYKGNAIGETAKQLWGLLLKHIFGGN
jgi:hypothetical protein